MTVLALDVGAAAISYLADLLCTVDDERHPACGASLADRVEVDAIAARPLHVGWPTFEIATRFARGRPIRYRLSPESGFQPDLEEL